MKLGHAFSLHKAFTRMSQVDIAQLGCSADVLSWGKVVGVTNMIIKSMGLFVPGTFCLYMSLKTFASFVLSASIEKVVELINLEATAKEKSVSCRKIP